MKKIRQKSDAIKLFLFLCLLGLSLLVILFAHRGWFRTHLPSDSIGYFHTVGYGNYFSESSLYDFVILWVFLGTPIVAACVTWLYMQYFKVGVS